MVPCRAAAITWTMPGAAAAAVLLAVTAARAAEVSDARARTAALPPGLFEVAVPGGTAALAEAAGLDPDTEPWRLLPDLTRRLYAPYGEKTAARVASEVADALRTASAHARPGPPAAGSAFGDGDGTVLRVPAGPAPAHVGVAADPAPGPVARLPLPLSPAAWRRILDDRRAPAATGADPILAAICTDAPAALLYRGLATFDAETAAALEGEPETLRRILRAHAPAFATFAPSFRVEGGRVAVPGGHEEAALWQELVGAPVLDPAEFLWRLASTDQGRLFHFYDTVERLDDARRRFATSATERDPERRRDRIRALKVLFGAAEVWWDPGRPEFARPVADPTRVLETVRVSPEGALSGPDREVLWQAAFDGQSEAARDWRERLAGSAPADAAWLVERISGVEPGLGRSRLAMVAFAQRVFGETAAGADPGDLLAALHGFSRYRALALALERMGIRDVGLHAAAARRAATLAGMGGSREGMSALAQFQGAMVLVQRAVQAGTLDAAAGAALVRTLLAVPLEDGRYRGGVASWIERELLPAFREGLGVPAAVGAEDVVLRALAGRVAGAAPPPLRWEGLDYHVDPPAAEYRRLRRLRARQGESRLEDALRAAPRDRDERLAATLTDLVYATALGPAEGAPAASEEVARRHEFGFEEAEAPGGSAAGWAMPREVAGPGERWRARGALLGLDVAFARLALQRLETDIPPAPRLSGAERRAFAEGVVLLRPPSLDDVGRDRIAAALGRGRERVREAVRGRALRPLLAELRVRDWRRGTLPWLAAVSPGDVEQAFTLAELLWLGRPQEGLGSLEAWGASGRSAEGGLRPRLEPPVPLDALAGRAPDGRMAVIAPDLHLRVAELLAAMGLPARLAPAVLALAVQDEVDHARPAYVDDALAVSRYARALTATRMEDYVAALVGQGPLVPVDR